MIDLAELVRTAVSPPAETSFPADFPAVSHAETKEVIDNNAFSRFPRFSSPEHRTYREIGGAGETSQPREMAGGARTHIVSSFNDGKVGNTGKDRECSNLAFPPVPNLAGTTGNAPLRLGAGDVTTWRAGLALLSPDIPPCPGLPRWPAMHAAILRFLDVHAASAAGLGWTTLELFGVHPVVGAVRVDCCGALMVTSGKDVASVERDAIRLVNGLTYRRAPTRADQSVPAWAFGS